MNDLNNSSALGPIIFANDTNLFYEHKYLFVLSSECDLHEINEWFEAKKLSLNVGKTMYSLVHKPSRKDGLSFLLPRLLIKTHKGKRVKSIKFVDVLLDLNSLFKLCKFITGQHKQNKSTQYELSTTEHALTIPTSFSTQKKYETFIS